MGRLGGASAIFGGAHVFNYFDGARSEFKRAAVAVPYLMATGGYLGLVYIKSDFSLSAETPPCISGTTSCWARSFIADPDHQPWVVQYGMPF